MSNVWFTSDLHIGHRKVAETRNFISDDPDAATEAHDAVLAAQWDHVVRRDDQVWILGDLSAGGKDATAYALNWITNRPGVKHLIAGNHDPVHPMYRDANQWQSTYLQAFASVVPFARRKIAGRQVLLSHFPYVGDHTTESRFNQYRLRDLGMPLLHGHTHSLCRTSYAFERFDGPLRPPGRSLQIHVGVDAWGLRPVHLDEIAELIAREDVS